MFLLYPNPAVTIVNLQLNEVATETLLVKVINQLGQEVKRTQVSKGFQLITFTVNDLPQGIYMVTVSGTGIKQMSKLIIQGKK